MNSFRPISNTICVHGHESIELSTGALEPSLCLSSAFAFESAEQAAGAFEGHNTHLIYSRWQNPMVAALESQMCALEGFGLEHEEPLAACAAASGMAAISGAILALCNTGDRVIAPRSMYGESARLIRERLPRFGINTTFVDQQNIAHYANAIDDSTRILYVETPANPNLILTDLCAVIALAKELSTPQNPIYVLVDNTFATPYAQRPLVLGANLVVHSMTKQLGGHGDAVGGIVVGQADLMTRIRDMITKGFGGVLSPFNAMLIVRGLRTFALRAKQTSANAMVLAEMLAQHPNVTRVYYPGHSSHAQYELALKQMYAFGFMIAFEVKGGLDAGRQVLERCRLITHAVSLGDVRSLITHPASTTHASMPADVRYAAGITDGLLRLSCGIEDACDLESDLAQALDV